MARNLYILAMCRFFFPSLASPRVKYLAKCQPLERIEPRTSWNKSCAGGPRPLSSHNGPQRTRIVSDKREKLFFRSINFFSRNNFVLFFGFSLKCKSLLGQVGQNHGRGWFNLKNLTIEIFVYTQTEYLLGKISWQPICNPPKMGILFSKMTLLFWE